MPGDVKFCPHCGSSVQVDAAPVYRPEVRTQPDNYLWLAILVTVLCCVPFGIVSIIFSSKVSSCWSSGDADGAVMYSRKAKNWALWGIGLSLALGILYIALIVILVMAGVMDSPGDVFI